ncbi:hypothetical protein MC885_006153, partial [Smutsia gigantea]
MSRLQSHVSQFRNGAKVSGVKAPPTRGGVLGVKSGCPIISECAGDTQQLIGNKPLRKAKTQTSPLLLQSERGRRLLGTEFEQANADFSGTRNPLCWVDVTPAHRPHYPPLASSPDPASPLPAADLADSLSYVQLLAAPRILEGTTGAQAAGALRETEPQKGWSCVALSESTSGSDAQSRRGIRAHTFPGSRQRLSRAQSAASLGHHVHLPGPRTTCQPSPAKWGPARDDPARATHRRARPPGLRVRAAAAQRGASRAAPGRGPAPRDRKVSRRSGAASAPRTGLGVAARSRLELALRPPPAPAPQCGGRRHPEQRPWEWEKGARTRQDPKRVNGKEVLCGNLGQPLQCEGSTRTP